MSDWSSWQRAGEPRNLGGGKWGLGWGAEESDWRGLTKGGWAKRFGGWVVGGWEVGVLESQNGGVGTGWVGQEALVVGGLEVGVLMRHGASRSR